MSLSKKMLRDIKINKTQFISIFLMAFLGIFAFCGVCGEYYGLEQTSSDFYSETNLADGWIYNTTITDDTLDKINNFTTGLKCMFYREIFKTMEFLLKECKVELVKFGGKPVKGANGEDLIPIKLRVVG